jgi:hypothetical protein
LIWLLDQLGSTIPEPLYRVARIALIVVAIYLIITVLLWARRISDWVRGYG